MQNGENYQSLVKLGLTNKIPFLNGPQKSCGPKKNEESGKAQPTIDPSIIGIVSLSELTTDSLSNNAQPTIEPSIIGIVSSSELTTDSLSTTSKGKFISNQQPTPQKPILTLLNSVP